MSSFCPLNTQSLKPKAQSPKHLHLYIHIQKQCHIHSLFLYLIGRVQQEVTGKAE